ncbi:hypothetical protein JVU11DRAFT_3558 [Chiua virens]|nr:hypothetical protein JVU11DRAFT_3558 [Chiua virens]
MSSRKSGLQREVLALYRRALRMIRTKPPESQPKFSLYCPPVTSHAIEHLLRRGKRQIEMYENSSIKDCQISQAMVNWERARGRKAETR